ncbi:DUF6492 family protein [Paenibacillus sp. KN14-4R]|uniref:DUF6492 family protein n=1 Tax=Paenibacillus sp. KN14-4R TaxID=3445773 RepID=UPI003FA07555
MSTTKIDIIIPAIEKDLVTLPYTIDGIRKYVQHPIGQILIISPQSKAIKQLCQRKHCKFIDEKTVLPLTKNDIHLRTTKWERSGWMYQQLLKLSGDTLSSQDFFLVMDADTVLIRPHVFRKNGKTIFYCRTWSHDEYFKAYNKLLGIQGRARLSYVTHYMLFERTKLAAMKRKIEKRHHMRWYAAILNKATKRKAFSFSEFETYGNYVRATYPGQSIQKLSRNRGLRTNMKNLSPTSLRKLAKKFKSLSFHKRKAYTLRSLKR